MHRRHPVAIQHRLGDGCWQPGAIDERGSGGCVGRSHSRARGLGGAARFFSGELAGARHARGARAFPTGCRRARAEGTAVPAGCRRAPARRLQVLARARRESVLGWSDFFGVPTASDTRGRQSSGLSDVGEDRRSALSWNGAGASRSALTFWVGSAGAAAGESMIQRSATAVSRSAIGFSRTAAAVSRVALGSAMGAAGLGLVRR